MLYLNCNSGLSYNGFGNKFNYILMIQSLLQNVTIHFSEQVFICYIYIYIYIYSCKLADSSRGWTEGFLFNSYYTEI